MNDVYDLHRFKLIALARSFDTKLKSRPGPIAPILQHKSACSKSQTDRLTISHSRRCSLSKLFYFVKHNCISSWVHGRAGVKICPVVDSTSLSQPLSSNLSEWDLIDFASQI